MQLLVVEETIQCGNGRIAVAKGNHASQKKKGGMGGGSSAAIASQIIAQEQVKGKAERKTEASRELARRAYGGGTKSQAVGNIIKEGKSKKPRTPKTGSQSATGRKILKSAANRPSKTNVPKTSGISFRGMSRSRTRKTKTALANQAIKTLQAEGRAERATKSTKKPKSSFGAKSRSAGSVIDSLQSKKPRKTSKTKKQA